MVFTLPYPIYGIVSDSDGDRINSYPLTIHNTTKNTKFTGFLNTNGKYVLDLANMSTGYTVGDSITVYIRYGGYTGEVTFTVAGEVGTQQDFTVYGGNNIATLRTDIEEGVFNTLQTGTFAISTNNIYGPMNDEKLNSTAYPRVIVYSPAIETSSLDFNKTLLRKEINVMIEIYHTNANQLRTLVDEIENKFWTATEVWNGLHLFNLDMPDNDYDWWNENKKKIHRSTLNANFEYVGRT